MSAQKLVQQPATRVNQNKTQQIAKHRIPSRTSGDLTRSWHTQHLNKYDQHKFINKKTWNDILDISEQIIFQKQQQTPQIQSITQTLEDCSSFEDFEQFYLKYIKHNSSYENINQFLIQFAQQLNSSNQSQQLVLKAVSTIISQLDSMSKMQLSEFLSTLAYLQRQNLISKQNLFTNGVQILNWGQKFQQSPINLDVIINKMLTLLLSDGYSHEKFSDFQFINLLYFLMYSNNYSEFYDQLWLQIEQCLVQLLSYNSENVQHYQTFDFFQNLSANQWSIIIVSIKIDQQAEINRLMLISSYLFNSRQIFYQCKYTQNDRLAQVKLLVVLSQSWIRVLNSEEQNLRDLNIVGKGGSSLIIQPYLQVLYRELLFGFQHQIQQLSTNEDQIGDILCDALLTEGELRRFVQPEFCDRFLLCRINLAIKCIKQGMQILKSDDLLGEKYNAQCEIGIYIYLLAICWVIQSKSDSEEEVDSSNALLHVVNQRLYYCLNHFLQHQNYNKTAQIQQINKGRGDHGSTIVKIDAYFDRLAEAEGKQICRFKQLEESSWQLLEMDNGGVNNNNTNNSDNNDIHKQAFMLFNLPRDELVDIVIDAILEKQIDYFNAPQVTAFSKFLSKLHRSNEYQLDRLAQQVMTNLDNYRSKEVLSVMKALTVHKYDNVELLDQVDAWITKQANKLSSINMVNTLYKYAEDGYCYPVLHQTILPVLYSRLDQLSCRQLVKICWACARLKVKSCAEQMPKIVNLVLQPELCPDLTPKTIGALLWSSGKLNYLPEESVLKLLFNLVETQLHKFDSLAIAQTLWFMVTTQKQIKGSNPSKEENEYNIVQQKEKVVILLYDRAYEIMDEFEGYNMSLLAWSFGKLRYSDKDFLDAFCEISTKTIPTMTPKNVANLVFAVARVGFLPPQSFLKTVEKVIVEKLDDFCVEELLNVMWAFAKFKEKGKLQHSLSIYTLKTISFLFRDEQYAQKLANRHISTALWCFAKLSYFNRPVIKNLLKQVYGRLQLQNSTLNDADLSKVFWSMAYFAEYNYFYNLKFVTQMEIVFGKMAAHMHVAWIPLVMKAFAWVKYSPRGVLRQFETRLLKEFHLFKDHEISDFMWSFAFLNFRPNSILNKLKLDPELTDRLSQTLTPHESIPLLWSLVYFECYNFKLSNQLYKKLMDPQLGNQIYDHRQLRFLFYAARWYEYETKGKLGQLQPLGIILQSVQKVRYYMQHQHPKNEKNKILRTVTSYVRSLGFETNNDPDNEFVDADLIIMGQYTTFAILIVHTDSFLRNLGQYTGETLSRIKLLSKMQLHIVQITMNHLDRISPHNQEMYKQTIIGAIDKGFIQAVERGFQVPEIQILK